MIWVKSKQWCVGWEFDFQDLFIFSSISFDISRALILASDRHLHPHAIGVCNICEWSTSLQWRHNGRGGVSNHQPHDCLLNRYSGTDQRKHQSSALLAFMRRIHRQSVNSPHKWPVAQKMFDDVIMIIMMGADALVPDRQQAINDHHVYQWTMTILLYRL